METQEPAMMKWKSMRQVHSRKASRLFPHGHHFTTNIMPEESVLMWTLLQPTLDTPWRHTYAWNGQLDGLVEAIDDSDFHSTYQQFSMFFDGITISKAMWSPLTNHLPCLKLRHVNLTPIQPPYVNCIHGSLTKLLESNTKKTPNQQLRTSNQQKAPQHTLQAPKTNCKTCQLKAAPLIFPNLHDTAHSPQDTAPVGAPTRRQG